MNHGGRRCLKTAVNHGVLDGGLLDYVRFRAACDS
jgi:hypothetical protein